MGWVQEEYDQPGDPAGGTQQQAGQNTGRGICNKQPDYRRGTYKSEKAGREKKRVKTRKRGKEVK